MAALLSFKRRTQPYLLSLPLAHTRCFSWQRCWKEKPNKGPFSLIHPLQQGGGWDAPELVVMPWLMEQCQQQDVLWQSVL